MTVFAKTVAERTAPGQRQDVEQQGTCRNARQSVTVGEIYTSFARLGNLSRERRPEIAESPKTSIKYTLCQQYEQMVHIERAQGQAGNQAIVALTYFWDTTCVGIDDKALVRLRLPLARIRS